MTNENRQGKQWILACGVIAAGFLFILGVVGIYLFTPLGKPVPTVEILQPTEAVGIQAGQGIVLTARGAARNGVQYINFLVNDIPVDQRSSGSAQPQTMDAAFTWFSGQPGIHKLSVISYNKTGIASEPESVLIVVHPRELAEAPQDAQAGDAQAGDAQAGDAQGQDASSSGPSSGAEVPANEGAAVGQGPAGVGHLVDHLDENDQFPVGVPGQPGDAPPEITSFQTDTVRDGNHIRVNYRVSAIDDIGLARGVVYASSLVDPLQPDRMQYICGGQQNCTHSDRIQLTRGGWLLSVQAVDTSGQVSEMHSRQVHVLMGDEPPAFAQGDGDVAFMLDPQLFLDHTIVVDLDADLDNIGEPVVAEYRCTMHLVVLDVLYTYASDHGDEADLWIMAEDGTNLVASGHTTIERGSGVARIQMELVDPDMPGSTDHLSLFFLSADGENFHTERIEKSMTWPQPLPDLKIADVTVGWGVGAGVLVFDVENMGCAPVDGFEIIVWREDGIYYSKTFEVNIPGKTTKRVSAPIVNDLNQYSRALQVVLDPDDVIDEINEDNNSYLKPPITLKQVHIHSIKIDNTSDGEWHQDSTEGEFYIYFLANEARTRRPQVDGMRWVLRTGMYDIAGPYINPVILSPSLDWDGYLLVEIMVREHDDIGSDDDACRIKFVHSPDMSDLDSWKGGGEFFAEDPGKCTVYWRLDVE
ncbi:MAG: hypothetical protein K8R77_14395 [Anaerolineaceae bacterium]|nr:hypothetical protein [Anaerolineaceae bacterium]